MDHHTELIAIIALGLSGAFIGGLIAWRLRLPVLIGYLAAGVAVGPFTPGFVGDPELATQLAEIGVILLMFGVGIHFSLSDLMAVNRIALPGAVVQITCATLLGMALAWSLGWSMGAGLILGLALSVASTVVLLRALTENGRLETRAGRVAIGWLLVEDLATVMALVMLPALAEPLGGVSMSDGDGNLARELIFTFGKVTLFAVLMLVAGVRVIPWLLNRVALTGSRELFILATLAIALGFAYMAAELFDASFALGAFLAGMVVNESELSHRAAEEALPLREAFAVLFFVSVGMLIDPMFFVDEIGLILAVLAIIVIGKGLAALLIVRLLGAPLGIGLTVAAGLAQVGEFSFILANLGVGLELLPEKGRNLILAGAIISITLNPVLFRLLPRIEQWVQDRGQGGGPSPEPSPS